MFVITDFNRLESETLFEWKLRLCKAKINKELDLDSSEEKEELEKLNKDNNSL